MLEDSESRKIGEIIDGLGLRMPLKEGDLVSEVVVVAKVIEADGQVRMSSSWSGDDWISRLGLLTAAQELEIPKNHGGCSCP